MRPVRGRYRTRYILRGVKNVKTRNQIPQLCIRNNCLWPVCDIRYFEHAHFIPIVGVCKKDEY